MEFGRIIALSDGEMHSIVKKQWLTKLFVCGDIISFIAQAGGTIFPSFLLPQSLQVHRSPKGRNADGRIGGSILAKQDPGTANTGKAIIILGLCIQILFFGFFLVNIISFWFRMKRGPTSASMNTPWQKHLTVLLGVGAIILVRCIYRVIEYIQGKDGNLQSQEIFLYVLDAGLMFIVMLIFHFWHPSEVNALLKGGKVAKMFNIHTVGKNEASIPLTDGESESGLTQQTRKYNWPPRNRV